jgi:hypothetical protein
MKGILNYNIKESFFYIYNIEIVECVNKSYLS